LKGGKMTIKDLEKLLKQVKKDHPSEYKNLNVFLSSDSEGNSYSTTDLGSNYWDNEKLVLYPFQEGIELEFKK
jgi:hypothetical protein